MIDKVPEDLQLVILSLVTHPVDRAALRCVPSLRKLVEPMLDQHLLNMLGASSLDYGIRMLSGKGPVMEVVKTTRYTSMFKAHRFTVRKIRTDFTFFKLVDKIFESVDAARVIDLCGLEPRRVILTEFFSVESGRAVDMTQKWHLELY